MVTKNNTAVALVDTSAEAQSQFDAMVAASTIAAKVDPSFIDMEVLNNLPSKSAKMRYLIGLGLKDSSIARILDCRVQFVNNIRHKPVKEA